MSDHLGESTEPTQLMLPAVLDLKAAQDLKQALEEACAREAPLQVDASQVQRVSSLCLQLLAAARKEFVSHPRFAITGPSTAFIETVTGLGLAEALGLSGEGNG